MSTTQIAVPLSREQAHALVDAVMEEDGLALNATAYEDDNGRWMFEALCDDKPDIEAFNAVASRVVGGPLDFRLEELDADYDWVSKSLEGLKPVIAGGFYVYGSHDAGSVPPGVTPILIEAAQAFGTGHHETTTGCLEAIDQTLKRRKLRRMLDVGTGTGVLAIALAKRTRLPVLATDIDPIAVRTTEQNARLNGVSNQIVAVEATGLEHRKISANAPYDLIVANILAGPLTMLAPAMGRVAQSGATIILSGILNRQAANVITAYSRQDMVLQRRIIRREWTTLVLEKRG